MDLDARELNALAMDLGDIAPETTVAVRRVMQDGAQDLKDTWRANAKETAGQHGRLYPYSITYETRELAHGLVAEVGPETARKQGGMGPGFEYGSRNQPPHLDGNRAADDLIPKIERRIAIAADDVFRDAL